MADPYNPYSSYSTPTPGGVGYYPPDDQTQNPAYGYQQHPYGNPNPEPYQTVQNQNQGFAPHQSQYNLTPEPYGSTQERSYTPTGQPDYQGPVIPTEYQHAQTKVPESASY
jgi:hypothetical protein